MRWLISLTIISLTTSVLSDKPDTIVRSPRFRRPLIKFLPAVVPEAQVQPAVHTAFVPAVQSDDVQIAVQPDVISEPVAVPAIAAASVEVAPVVTGKRIMPFMAGSPYFSPYGGGLQDWYNPFMGGFGGYGPIAPRTWGPRWDPRGGRRERRGNRRRRNGGRNFGGSRSERRDSRRDRRGRRRTDSVEPKVDVPSIPIPPAVDTNVASVPVPVPADEANAAAEPTPIVAAEIAAENTIADAEPIPIVAAEVAV